MLFFYLRSCKQNNSSLSLLVSTTVDLGQCTRLVFIARSEGSGDSAHMHRVARAVAALFHEIVKFNTCTSIYLCEHSMC